MAYILWNNSRAYFIRSTLSEIEELKAKYGLENYRLFVEELKCPITIPSSLKTETESSSGSNPT